MAMLRVLVLVAVVAVLASNTDGKSAHDKKKADEPVSWNGVVAAVVDKVSNSAKIATKAFGKLKNKHNKESSQDSELLSKAKEGAVLRSLLEKARSVLVAEQKEQRGGRPAGANDFPAGDADDMFQGLEGGEADFMENFDGSGGQEYSEDQMEDVIQQHVEAALAEFNPNPTCAALVGFLSDGEHEPSDSPCQDLGEFVAVFIAIFFNVANFAISMTGFMLGVLPMPSFGFEDPGAGAGPGMQ